MERRGEVRTQKARVANSTRWKKKKSSILLKMCPSTFIVQTKSIRTF